MACFNLENANLFLEEAKIKHYDKEEHLCIRFIRKKYKCLMLWGLSILALVEMGIILLDKFDDNMFNQAMNVIFHNSKNYTDEFSSVLLKCSELFEKFENVSFCKERIV